MSTNSKRWDQFSEYSPNKLEITMIKGAVNTSKTANGRNLQKVSLFNFVFKA